MVNFSLLAQTADIEVNIVGIKPISGKIMIALFNSKETYFELDKMLAGYEINVDSTNLNCTFHDLPFGTYAITIYHDEDNNGKMNRNWLGMPTEGYAFSNNFSSSIRPASFNDAAFELTSNTKLIIKMHY